VKKIHTKVILKFNKATDRFDIADVESYWHSGNVAYAKGEAPSSSGTQIQKTEPWAAQQPYLTRGFEEAQKTFLDSPAPQLYPGQTVTPYSPERETGLQLSTLRALNGSPTQDAASNEAYNTLSGNYLYGNPGFNAALDSAARKVLPQIDSRFEQSGRFNSGLSKVAQTQALADSFADQYGQERTNQQRALALAPQVIGQDYADFDKLVDIGNQREALTQNFSDDAANRYGYNQNIRQQQVKDYLAAIQGNYGSSGTTNTTTSGGASNNGSTGLNALAGGFGGYKLASSLGGFNPFLGAGLGVLAGLF
jgi:hypothetical protein